MDGNQSTGTTALPQQMILREDKVYCMSRQSCICNFFQLTLRIFDNKNDVCERGLSSLIIKIHAISFNWME